MAMTCLFNQCKKEAITGLGKCAFHRHRNKCSVENCTNQAVVATKCVRHGGKRLCQAIGCKQHARGGRLCSKHGGISHKRFCKEVGCTKQAHANKKCIAHGGRRDCTFPGCSHHARSGGLCQYHQSNAQRPFDDILSFKIDMSIMN
ncbi:hypothetical protein LEN26_012739 [Aphanomyces euteiches]|nr:hypothetical protein LEN26_012739 [Aphanomyces euteiches]KAH9119875.1 hypothetical protein AeMF1_007685 [Aphanomyces euteiches]KAH9184945.1 hypothetical protein AeNC1_013077 [Aphanomyces euteiches]